MKIYLKLSLILLIFTHLGINIFGTSEIYATGSFEVPQIDEHFDQVKSGPSPDTPKSITHQPVEEPGFWDKVGKGINQKWNQFTDFISNTWDKTKDIASETWDWIINLFKKMTQVIVDTLSDVLDWISENIVPLVVTLIIAVVAIILIIYGSVTIGVSILVGMVISLVISLILNDGKFDGTTLWEMAIGGLLGPIGFGFSKGAQILLRTPLIKKIFTSITTSRFIGSIFQGGKNLISKSPQWVQTW